MDSLPDVPGSGPLASARARSGLPDYRPAPELEPAIQGRKHAGIAIVDIAPENDPVVGIDLCRPVEQHHRQRLLQVDPGSLAGLDHPVDPVLVPLRLVIQQQPGEGEGIIDANTAGAEGAPGPDEGLPGELLIAEIRRLQDQAEQVRLGREIGQRGLEEMPNGVLVFSALGELLFINSAGQRLLSTEIGKQAGLEQLDPARGFAGELEHHGRIGVDHTPPAAP